VPVTDNEFIYRAWGTGKLIGIATASTFKSGSHICKGQLSRDRLELQRSVKLPWAAYAATQGGSESARDRPCPGGLRSNDGCVVAISDQHLDPSGAHRTLVTRFEIKRKTPLESNRCVRALRRSFPRGLSMNFSMRSGRNEHRIRKVQGKNAST
jgi:hypothetical protein